MAVGAKPTVAEALASVMQDVPVIGKDQAVTTGPARFRFRGVDDVMDAVGRALRTHGVVFAPARVVSLDHERYETSKGASMDAVTVVVEYTITGPGGDTMTVAAAGQSADAGDKAVPKAMSVAYRTVLLQTLCIPSGDPDPDQSVHERAAQPARVPDIREPLWADIKTAREGKGWSSADVASDFAAGHADRKLMDATADELQAYLLTLTTPPEVKA